MEWVVVENTLVIIAASVPLLRPIFNKTKSMVTGAYGPTSSYEMNSRSQGAKGFSSKANIKSIQLQSSSEENILADKGPRSVTNVTKGNNTRESRDVEKGIKKETTVQIRYDEDDGAPPASKWNFSK